MRHASQAHRVELDWLFDRTNLDPGIQKNTLSSNQQMADSRQFADILTKGSSSLVKGGLR